MMVGEKGFDSLPAFSQHLEDTLAEVLGPDACGVLTLADLAFR